MKGREGEGRKGRGGEGRGNDNLVKTGYCINNIECFPASPTSGVDFGW